MFELYGNIKRQERLDAEIREKKVYSKCRYCKKKLSVKKTICKRCLRLINKSMLTEKCVKPNSKLGLYFI